MQVVDDENGWVTEPPITLVSVLPLVLVKVTGTLSVVPKATRPKSMSLGVSWASVPVPSPVTLIGWLMLLPGMLKE